MKTTQNILFTLVILLLSLTEMPIYSKLYSIQAVAKNHNYPEIELNINIRDLITGKGLLGLNLSDFKIYENGDIQTIKSYSQNNEGNTEPIDIVYIFDETGSMQDELNAVSDNSLMFSEYLSSANMDFRIALITFSDKVEKKYDFTNDIGLFKERIASIKAKGGDDFPENSLDALAEALKLKFRTNAKVVFILITDAPYHQGDHVTKRYMLPLLKKIKLEKIKIYPISNEEYEQYVWMARETEGQFFNISDSFVSIIEELAVDLVAPYKIKYIPQNSSFDNTNRMVEIKIKKIGSTIIEYKSASIVLASSQLIEKGRPANAYKVENMIDNNRSTAWCEGDVGDGIGEWVKFGFEKPRNLSVIKIIAGYAKTKSIFENNNRIRKLKIYFSDGKYQIADLEDVDEFQYILIDRNRPTSFIKMEILDVYRGSRYRDTCISEVEFKFKD